MRGEIISFDLQASSGIISGEDGNRYSFNGKDIRENFNRAKVGAKVDFNSNGEYAEDIFLLSSSATADGKKDKIIAAVLALFLGGLGVHKFYLGKKNAGIIMLVVSVGGAILLFIPTLIIGVIAFIEAVIYLIKSEDDFQREYVEGDKSWF